MKCENIGRRIHHHLHKRRCHPERSETSLVAEEGNDPEILRFAQDDN